ncbi:MAG: ATP-dependent zinc metalloprotease FtsH [Bacteroidaceae bacterium]|nr:ATP-dependent zinc metalloprotease FtsH [Bacteroidaceae bacterium]
MDTNKNNTNNNNNRMQKPRFNFTWLYILLIAGLAFMIFTRHDTSASRSVDYTTFKEFVEKGYVADVVINKDNNTLTLAIDSKHEKQVYGVASKNKKPARIKVEFGSIDNLENFLDEQNKEGVFKGKVSYERDNDFISNLLWNFAPLIIIILIWIFIMRGMGSSGFMGGAGSIFSVGKSKAQLFEKDDKNSPQITFKDVAGQAGAKQEVQEIVDFLKKPEKYTNLGGKIPKGALLVGPPGTGKTLLAKAVAGEAGVPFFSLSGSEFVEMFVGVGASRVRDLFQQAKAKAPCIIFIDEIDAIGRARSKTAAMGGNDERESTLNQLLTEMDGFGTNSGIIIMAATNRADILDGALLRAGRFDRQIHVDLPDLNERKEIFMVHLKPLKIDETVDVAQLARQTPGFSGADIANVCNEAALIAARNNKDWVDKQCFLDAVDRIIGGLEKKTKLLTAQEKRTIALHEAGHATISWFLEYANPLVKVTIVPRGQALGAAWYMPEERQISTKEEILDEICATLGGRAAEELFTGRISTGAMNDLEKVTKRAYGMIAYAGMGEKLPNLCYYDNQEYQFNKPYSDKTAETIDEEVRNLISGEYERAKKVLLEHKDGHAQLAQRLIEKEVIFAEDLEEIFGKRPWTSRTDEILAANAEEDQAEDEQSNNATDHKKENEEIIRQKIVQAVIEKAEKAKEAEQNAPDASADQQSETDKPKEA